MRFLNLKSSMADSSSVDSIICMRTHAPSFFPILRDIRAAYSGLLTYAANWDDVDQTVILGELDVIGVNAFYPLTDKSKANEDRKSVVLGKECPSLCRSRWSPYH